MKQLWEILVPATDKRGIEIPVAYHREWDQFVRDTCGGLTLARTVKGQWVSPEQKTVAEPMIPVRIVCDRLELDQILEFTCKHYDQEEVMAYEISRDIVFWKRME